MLDKRGTVLETARRVSALLRENNITGAVIGGVSVVLHGHVRTTRVVDVWISGPLSGVSRLLESSGATFDAARREFLLDSVPVHLVDQNVVQPPPKQTLEIEKVLTVSLPDLINLKLRSGLKHVTRAQDLADVIGLIRAHHLRGDFAGKLDKSLRAEFRELAKAVQRES